MRIASDADVQVVEEAPNPSPMSRAEASRINGAKSRGPKSAEGKAVSSRNALKHGLTARAVLFPGEDPAQFEAFVSDLHSELKPEGTLQRALVDRAAELAWKLRRLPAVEGAILANSRDALDESQGALGDLLHELIGKDSDGVLMRLQRYEIRLERSLRNCLRELRAIQDRQGQQQGTQTQAHDSATVEQPSVQRFPGSFGLGAMSDEADRGGTPPASEDLPPDERTEPLQDEIDAGDLAQVRDDPTCEPTQEGSGSFCLNESASSGDSRDAGSGFRIGPEVRWFENSGAASRVRFAPG